MHIKNGSLKKAGVTLSLLLVVMISGPAFAENFSGLNRINQKNWAVYFDDLLGYVYDSHGCLHFTPADIYLLTKVVVPGTPLHIEKYGKKDDNLSVPDSGVPTLAELVSEQKNLTKLAQDFKSKNIRLVVYPSLGRLYILADGAPMAQVKMLAGPDELVRMAFAVERGGAIEWDAMLATPTDPGDYKIFGSTTHYISGTYYDNTVVPFGAWMVKKGNQWIFKDDDKWYPVPSSIVYDLNLLPEKRQHNYYDVVLDAAGQVMAARWASHDFGKEVLFWSKDGKRIYPEMGYAAGELQYEQVVLVQDLVHLLTVNGPDDFEDCVAQNQNFSFYKGLYEFVNSKGGRLPPDVQRSMLGYYKLYRSLPLTEEDKKYLDTRVTQAFLEYKEGRLPRKGEARYQVLGLVYFLKINSLAIEKQAGWYEKVRRDWEFFKSLRQELRQDFDKMGILSSENRQNVLEDWINARLEFKTATLPRQAKNLGDLSFSDFFRPAEENPAFTARERALMQEVIKKAAGEKKGLNLSAVEALNNYNFGVWLNEILGDLYRSHGCLHVSPRNIYFLYELLPVNTPVTVYDYSKKITAAQHAAIPSLANLVNFAQDLEKLKEKFMGTAEARVAVYPSAGLWIIFLDNQPFAKLQVKGGPQTPMYTVQGRDDKGSPVFEDHLAYPTTTGSFRVLNKVQDYVSNIYYDTTVIPMGGEIIKTEKRWKFKDANGKWQVVPKVIQEDLDAPAAQRQYTYYDEVVSVSGEVVALRWGSHPFGKYAIQNTKDGYNLFPELIHSSGDLMMEERQLINDLIKILSAPYDDLDKCIKASPNFELYKACFDFMRDPSREDLIQPRERLSYRLYQGLPISSSEASLLPKDVIAADKVLRKQPLNNEEINVLLSEGVAYRRGTKINLYNEKILGLQFDTYQYVVVIQKYAHHYEVLRQHWKELSGLRRALLQDFNNFVIKDPVVLHNFTRELMLKRTRLEKLTQEDALNILAKMLGIE